MDVQLRKIQFIQEFLRFNNEQIIEKFEKLLKSEKRKIYSDDLKPLTFDEFNELIDNAEDDSNNNRLTDVHQLKKEISSWS
jgi:hypothetical protein